MNSELKEEQEEVQVRIKEEQEGRIQEGQCPPRPLSDVEQLLLENEKVLAEIMMESSFRKNKNMISPRMSLLINRMERNLIKIARQVPPEALAEPRHVFQEKERFLRFYQKRNGTKKLYQSASKQREREP